MLLCGYTVGIDKLQFQPNGDISGMVSAEGELVPLKTRIKPSAVGGAVERWLIQVLLLAHMSDGPAYTAFKTTFSFTYKCTAFGAEQCSAYVLHYKRA